MFVLSSISLLASVVGVPQISLRPLIGLSFWFLVVSAVGRGAESEVLGAMGGGEWAEEGRGFGMGSRAAL